MVDVKNIQKLNNEHLQGNDKSMSVKTYIGKREIKKGLKKRTRRRSELIQNNPTNEEICRKKFSDSFPPILLII